MARLQQPDCTRKTRNSCPNYGASHNLGKCTHLMIASTDKSAFRTLLKDLLSRNSDTDAEGEEAEEGMVPARPEEAS